MTPTRLAITASSRRKPYACSARIANDAMPVSTPARNSGTPNSSLQAERGAEELGQVGRHRDDLRLRPQPEHHGAAEAGAAGLGQVQPGGDAELGAHRLDEHRHQVRHDDDPQQQVAERRAAGHVGREVARVDVGHGGDERRARGTAARRAGRGGVPRGSPRRGAAPAPRRAARRPRWPRARRVPRGLARTRRSRSRHRTAARRPHPARCSRRVAARVDHADERADRALRHAVPALQRHPLEPHRPAAPELDDQRDVRRLGVDDVPLQPPLVGAEADDLRRRDVARDRDRRERRARWPRGSSRSTTRTSTV